MIGLILLYFIGKSFYDLSEKHKKSKWGFAILGIITYYAGTFIGGILLALISLLSESHFADTLPKIVISLLCIPIGLLSCWGLHSILKSSWSKKAILSSDDTLDGNVLDRI